VKSNDNRETPRVAPLTVLVYVACATIWGTTWFGIRRCIEPGGYPPFAGAAVRFAIAAAILGAFYAAGGGRPGPRGRKAVGGLVACGLLSAFSYGLVYAAERSISGGLAAVLYGTFPLCTAVLATVGRIERVTRRALVGSVVSLGGIALVFVDRLQFSRAQAVGVLLVLASVVASSLYTALLKRVAEGVHPMASTGVFLGTAGVGLGVFAAVFERRALPWPPPPGPTAALLYLAIVGSVLVFAAYFYLLQRVSLMAISTLVLLEPVIALGVDAAAERDVVLLPRSYAGMAVVIAGVAVSVFVRPAGGRRARGSA
jgi:drug/metabolite transporter (DMT)-like permease